MMNEKNSIENPRKTIQKVKMRIYPKQNTEKAKKSEISLGILLFLMFLPFSNILILEKFKMKGSKNMAVKYKATYRIEKVDTQGKHNDRNFDVTKSDHINQDRMHLNKYWNLYGYEDRTFEEIEKMFYEKVYSKHIDAQNQRYIKGRKKNLCISVNDYYKAHRTRPEDLILQVGNKNQHISGEELWQIAMDYKEKFNEVYGAHCKILTMALHMDEATPHVHIRRAWIGEDKEGYAHASCESALRCIGYEWNRTDTSKKNNAKIKFTETERKMFENVCRDHEIDIDVDNRIHTEHLSVEDYKKKMMSEEATKTQKQLEEEAENRVQALLESECRVLEQQMREQILMELEEEYEKKKKETEENNKKMYKQQLTRYAQKIIDGIENMKQYDFMEGKIDMDSIKNINNFDELLEATGEIQKTFLEEAEMETRKIMSAEWENIEKAQRKVNRKWQVINEVLQEQDNYQEMKSEYDRRMEVWKERDDMLYI